MNNDLIKRIDESFFFVVDVDGQQRLNKLLADCRAEIERLSKPYVPMTESDKLILQTQLPYSIYVSPDAITQVETAVIKRAGLNVVNQCFYPNCLDNEDERCPKWLTGKCKSAGLVIKQ